MKKTLAVLSSALILLIAGTLPSYGQVPLGEVLGTVTDQSDAVVAGATVTLKNEQTGKTRVAQSDENGNYVFVSLESATYTVMVQKEGFATTISNGNSVQVEEKKRVDARLRVGSTKDEVVVTSDSGAKIDTETAAIGSIVNSREVLALPLNGREFSQLALVMPGTVKTGDTGGALNTFFATAVRVGGTGASKNAFSIDGADNTFNVWNGPAMNPSIDAIQEFRIDRSNFGAEFGRGGAEFELVTKGGTNQFHGAAWEFVRNATFNAADYQSHERDNLSQNQYGLNLGGPIKSNRAFFFFNWEGQRRNSTDQPLGTVFTQQMRTGDLSQFGTPIIDPQTGQPFPNNIIPTDRLDPTALSYMNAMIGPPNVPGDADGVLNNFVGNFITTLNYDQYVGKVDFLLSPKDSIFFRMNVQPRSGIAPPATANSINSVESMHWYNTAVGWTRSWTPHLLTETRLSYHGEFFDIQNGTANVYGLPTDTITGFGGSKPAQDRLPILDVAPYYTFAEWGFPWVSTQHAYQLIANVTATVGRHIVKAGFDGRHLIFNRKEFGQDEIDMSFTGAYTGNGVGDYLLGLPFAAGENLQPAQRVISRGDYAVFVEDNWSVTPSLTVTLGLRYEIKTQPVDILNRQSNFNPSSQQIVVAGDKILTQYVAPPILTAYAPVLTTATEAHLPTRSLLYGDHNDFAPRVGFAWRPNKNNKTVVRGGYGIYYILGDGNNDAQLAVSSVPYGGHISNTNTTPDPSFNMAAPFGGAITPPPPPSPFFFPSRRRDTYVQQASIGIQRQLPWGIIGEINIQDQNSKKLEGTYNVNQVQAGGSGPLQPRRPYQQFGNITTFGHDGYARYDALEVDLRKTTSHVMLDWNHTWAKNLGRTNAVDPYNPNEFHGPFGYVPNLDKLSFVADLPFGEGRRWAFSHRALDAIAGGWTVSGLGALYQGGGPLNVTWSGDPSGTGTFVAFPNQTCGPKLSNPTKQKWFNTSCFTDPTPGTFGNTRQGAVFGPSQFSYDLAVLKNFRLTEKANLQFRSEFFNAFNHPNLANPGTCANCAGFGQILTKTLVPRVLQFALRFTY